MASVEKRYNKAGTPISFRIHVFHGRDEFGKQLPPFIKTVRVPPELNARQIETLIQRETVHFEEECELITAREKEEAAKAAEPKCISFEDFAAKVMEIKERTGKEKSTLARYQDMLDSRINPYLGKTPVDEITGDMLDDFYAMLLKPGQNKKTGGGLSRKTVLEHHHVISTIMEHAIRKHLIAFNPCRDATPPVADPPMPNYYQPADLTLIRQALENESVKWYTLIHVLIRHPARGVRGHQAECRRPEGQDHHHLFLRHVRPKERCVREALPQKAQAASAADYPADGRNPAPLPEVARRTARMVRGPLAGKWLLVYQ